MYCMYYLISVCLHPLCLSGSLTKSYIDSDLNRLVMDYLVIEGFKSAAEEFSRESGLIAPVDLESIESRMNIREALQRGDVGEAIARVNDLNPEVSIRSDRVFSCKGDERIITFHAPL